MGRRDWAAREESGLRGVMAKGRDGPDRAGLEKWSEPEKPAKGH